MPCFQLISLQESPCRSQNTVLCLSHCVISFIFHRFISRNWNKLHFPNNKVDKYTILHFFNIVLSCSSLELNSFLCANIKYTPNSFILEIFIGYSKVVWQTNKRFHSGIESKRSRYLWKTFRKPRELLLKSDSLKAKYEEMRDDSWLLQKWMIKDVNAGRFCMSAILLRILHQLRFCCFSAMQLLQYKFCLNYLKDNVTSLVIKIRYNSMLVAEK